MTFDIANQLHLATLAFGSGLIGIVAHAVKKWQTHDAESVWAWLVRDNFRATVGSLGALVAAVAGAIAGDLFSGMTAVQIAVLAFPYGYANDSVVNRGAAPGAIQ